MKPLARNYAAGPDASKESSEAQSGRDDDSAEKSDSPQQTRSGAGSGCSLPPGDPGDLLDRFDVSEHMSVHRHSEQSASEVSAACVDALIVYAAEASKKSECFTSYLLIASSCFSRSLSKLHSQIKYSAAECG